jgi:transposase
MSLAFLTSGGVANTLWEEIITMVRKARRASQSQKLPASLKHVHLNAAGIDVGAESHYVAVPVDRDSQPVRSFSAYTPDLNKLADWLKTCRVDTVAMESTGVYWIPLYEVLERGGFEVYLVSPQHLKRVPGRKTDVLDCQWLQELHTFGLLSGAFRPQDIEAALRSYMRQRAMLVGYASQHIQHMQKALTQMNVLVHHAVDDITGVSGMRIVRAIIAGERNPATLAAMREPGCKKDAATVAQALEGNWREEHLFALRQAVELFDSYQAKVHDCDQQILTHLKTMEDRSNSGTGTPPQSEGKSPRKNELSFDGAAEAYRITGVDLTKITGIKAHTALKIVSEIGTDVVHWPTAGHFTSWLTLAPRNRISGGKRLSQRNAPANANRLAQALKMAAYSLHNSHSYLGAFYRRLAARVGKAKAIQATARKLAIQVYYALKYGTDYVEKGAHYYESTYRDRVLKNMSRRAKELGYRLVKEDLSVQTL